MISMAWNEIKPPYYRVWPEFGSSGIWMIEEPLQKTAGSMVTHESLCLPKDLVQRFNTWIEWHFQCMPDRQGDKFDWVSFEKVGYQLARDLKDFLGYEVYVEYDEKVVPFTLRVYPDVGCGLWTNQGGVFISIFDPPEDLENRLEEWLRWYAERLNDYLFFHGQTYNYVPDEAELQQFVNKGRELSREIKKIVGEKAEVVYVNVVRRARKDGDQEYEII